MVKCGVFFSVRTEFLSNIYSSLGFKGLTTPFCWIVCYMAYPYHPPYFIAQYLVKSKNYTDPHDEISSIHLSLPMS
jgi:hypothetical protein